MSDGHEFIAPTGASVGGSLARLVDLAVIAAAGVLVGLLVAALAGRDRFPPAPDSPAALDVTTD